MVKKSYQVKNEEYLRIKYNIKFFLLYYIIFLLFLFFSIYENIYIRTIYLMKYCFSISISIIINEYHKISILIYL